MREWKLNEPNITFCDRLRICSFFLNPKSFWTMGEKVALFEKGMADCIGSQYAVFVSSGSTANTLLAMYLRDNSSSSRNTVLFPSTTWTTSVSPFIREGFTPQFIDVNLEDFSMDLGVLEDYLKAHSDEVACVFITSLIGFVPDIDRIRNLEQAYKVRIMMDNCENTLGLFKSQNVSSFFTSTTSTYFGHQLQSVEGGFVFTNSPHEYEYFLMARNHGMTRSLKNPARYKNPDIDPRFDFSILGNNFRNTDINALIGLLDLKRAPRIHQARKSLYKLFFDSLKNTKSLLMPDSTFDHCPFCLPILCDNRYQKKFLMEYCRSQKIECRPLISGNLLRQTVYKKFGRASDFTNSEYLHHNSFYVGLHPKVNPKNIKKLTNTINNTLS